VLWIRGKVLSSVNSWLKDIKQSD